MPDKRPFQRGDWVRLAAESSITVPDVRPDAIAWVAVCSDDGSYTIVFKNGEISKVTAADLEIALSPVWGTRPKCNVGDLVHIDNEKPRLPWHVDRINWPTPYYVYYICSRHSTQTEQAEGAAEVLLAHAWADELQLAPSYMVAGWEC